MLRALEEQGLLPDIVAGTSAGSIIAGCLAAGLTPGKLGEEVEYLSEYGNMYLDPDYWGMLRFCLLYTSCNNRNILENRKIYC